MSAMVPARASRNKQDDVLLPPKVSSRMNPEVVMKIFTILCVAVPLALSSAAFAQSSGGSSGGGSGGGTSGTGSGSMSSSPGAASGGSLGSSAGAPGTNSAGTALPSGGGGTVGQAPLGTGDPSVDKEDKNVDRKVKSICKGC